MDYKPFYIAVCAWNRKKSFENFKNIYIEGFTYENPYKHPLYRLFKIAKNTLSGKYIESEAELKTRWEIVKDELTAEDKIKLASDENTSVDILCHLADEIDPFIHIQAIINPNIPHYKLYQLTDDENWAKRHAITLNPEVTQDVLKKLSKDNNFNVYAAANRKLQTKKNECLDLRISFAEESTFRRSANDIAKNIKHENIK